MDIFLIAQNIIHYGLHFLFPGILAWWLYRTMWVRAWIIIVATNIIDIDHLFANPIFDPTRCSINFHPLHTGYAFIVYCILFLIPKTRIVGIGLILHIIADALSCYWMT